MKANGLIEKIRQEIERRYEDNLKAEEMSHAGIFGSAAKEDYDLLSFLDTIQVEEPIDLEKYIENEIAHYGLSLTNSSYGNFSASEIYHIMRKFYELGKNAK